MLRWYEFHEIKYRIKEFFGKLTNKFMWGDIEYTLRKIVRFPLRVWKWKNIIFHDENWDYAYLINVMEFKLRDIEKALREDPHHVNSDKRAKEVRIILAHLDRYRNIGKYTTDTDIEEFLGNSEFVPSDIEKYQKTISRVVYKKTFPFLEIKSESVEMERVLTYQYKQKDEKLAKIHYRIHESQRQLEEWHLKEFWRRIIRTYQGWWC
jgi:hypothetical protein